MDLHNKKVIFRAPCVSVSGYGVHSRQIALYLDKMAQEYNWDTFFQITGWGRTPFLLDDYAEKDIIEKYNRPYNYKEKPDISFQLVLPNEWDTSIAEYNVGITAGVETDKCSQQWIDACNKMNVVIVPSEHIKNTFNNSGKIVTPIIVLHESFKEDVYKENLKSTLDIELDTKFNFLLVGQITGNVQSDRKNIANTLKWFIEAFDGRNDIGLVIKTNSSGNSKLDKNSTMKNLKGFINEIRNKKTNLPKIYLLHGYMTDDEIAQLYKYSGIKAFITATRGEGFGLPILEAAVSGLPLIVTDWSGHLDIVDVIEDSCTKLDYNIVDIHASRIDNNIFVSGAKWAEVKEVDIKDKMLYIVENYDDLKRKAEKLKKETRKVFNPEYLYKQFKAIVEEEIK